MIVRITSAIALSALLASACTQGRGPRSIESKAAPLQRAVASSPAPPIAAGFAPGRVVFYYSHNGDIFSRSAEPGTNNVTESRAIETRPAVSAAGLLYFQRATARGPELVLQLSEGHECCYRPGAAPAFPTNVVTHHPGPTSFAFVVAARVLPRGGPGYGRHLEIAIGNPGSEAEYGVPARGTRAAQVSNLTFDAGWPHVPYLYYKSRGTVLGQRLRVGSARVDPYGGPAKLIASSDAVRFAAVASDRRSSVDLLRVSTQGQKPTLSLVRVHVGVGSLGRIFASQPAVIASLDHLDLDLSHPKRLELDYAGCLGVGTHHHFYGVVSFGLGAKPAWFVSDHKTVYVVDSTGRYARIPDVTSNAGIAPIPVRCLR